MHLRLRLNREATLARSTNSDPWTYHPGVMAQTYDDTGYAQRLQEALDPDTPSWRLAELAGDSEPDVRMAVAANALASSLTVLRLQRDTDPRVRLAASTRHGDRGVNA